MLTVWGVSLGSVLAIIAAGEDNYGWLWLLSAAGVTTVLITLFAPIRFHGNFLERRLEKLKEALNAGDFTLDELASSPVRTFNFGQLAQTSPKFFNAISGKEWRYGDHLYEIHEKTKHGSYKAVNVYYSVLEIDMPRRLPNILFDTHKSHKRQFRTYFDKSQIHSLEGNFDQHFTTYFPKFYTIDALAIITPEVMQTMIAADQYDIEIVGDKLYLYGPLVPAKLLPDMVKKGLAVRDTLMNNVVTYRDERLAGNEGRARVTMHGAQLRENPYRGWQTILIGLALLAVAAFAFKEQTEDAFQFLIYGIAVVGVQVVSIWTKIHKNRTLDKKYAALTANPKPR